MDLTCAILLANFCLPLETQSIQVNAGAFGASARVETKSAHVILELSSDEVVTTFMGMRQVCRNDQCAYVSSSTTSEGGLQVRQIRIGLKDAGSIQRVQISGPTVRSIEDTAQAIKVRLGDGTARKFVSLQDLTSPQ